MPQSSADLFPETKVTRRRPRVLMHVYDAGDCSEGHIVQFRCATCGYDSGWLHTRTVTEAKRGLPCPMCNKS